MNNVKLRLMKVFSETFHIDPSNAADFMPEWDSLDHLQLIMSIENEFAIKFHAEKILKLLTFEEILKEVQQEITSNLILREATREDAEALADMLNRHYERKRHAHYFVWQYFSSTQPAKLFIALDGDSIVGTYGLQLRMTKCGLSGFATDTLIVESFRGSGLFLLLEHEALCYAQNNGAILLATLANKNGMLARNNRFGWEPVSQIPQMKKIGHPLFKGVISGDLNSSFNPEREMNFFETSFKLRKWRFDENPVYEYYYVYSDSGDFAVTKLFVDPISKDVYGDIVDFQCPLFDLDALKRLFIEACNFLQKQNVSCITTWALSHEPLFDILLDLGFIEEQAERYFCVNVLDKQYYYLKDISAWHLVQADSEIY